MSTTQSVNPILFADSYTVTDVDRDGKKYLKISRLVCKAANLDVTLTVDINIDAWEPVAQDERLTIAVAHTLDLEGLKGGDHYDHSIYHKRTLMSDYDYVMYGQVYECDTDAENANKVVATVSFGGLLMKIEGDVETLREITYNRNIYLLMKKQ
jgi:DNA-directed RNA polymerase I, II, and III subunit RPABC3